MTAQQFNSKEGQKFTQLKYEHDEMLNRQGYYSKSVAKLAHRMAILKGKIELLYPKVKTQS